MIILFLVLSQFASREHRIFKKVINYIIDLFKSLKFPIFTLIS